MFKFELDQLVFFLKDNRFHSAPVLSRKYVDNQHEDWDSTPEQQHSFKRFGDGGIIYATINGEHQEGDLYASKIELVNELARDYEETSIENTG